MTISTTSSATTLFGNGVTTEFTFSFAVPSADDLAVIYADPSGAQTTLTPSQYTVTLNSIAVGQTWPYGGTVAYPTSGDPIENGASITIIRTVPLTQVTSIHNQGNFYPLVVERGLDRLEMQVQQVAARTGQVRGTWAADVTYNFGDIVQDGPAGNDTNNLYTCAVANVSSVWEGDLAAGYWSLALDISTITVSVTSVAVSGEDGIGVSGSPITSDGTITLSLGAITPTSVNGLTVSGGASSALTIPATSSLVRVGAHALTLTSTGATDVTFPTSGTIISNVGGVVALGTADVTGTGSIGATGARITKLWAAAVESTAAPTINGTGQAVNTDPTGVTGADKVTNIMSLTTAEYAAIGAPNASTLYIITDA